VEALWARAAAQDKVGGRIICRKRKLTGLGFEEKWLN